jgi:PST family polysaccharide transporter
MSILGLRGARPLHWSRALVESLRPPQGDPLEQDSLGAGLGRRSARGAASTVLGQWARFVLQMLSTVVLARLVDPEQYGLVGMVVAIVGVGDALSNVGLSQATVQRKDITQPHVTLFFWLQVAVGAVLTALTMLGAGLLAGFYGHPELVTITLVLAPTFLLNALSAQHQAVLSRQMRFGVLALIDVVGLALGVTVAIAMAAEGAGVWAIVELTLAVPVCRVVMSWYASGWSPGKPRAVPGSGQMVKFGLNLTASNVLDYSAQNVDNVLIGRFYGAGALGLYSRAYGLLLLPIRQVTAPLARVAVPVLSYLLDQPDRYRRFYRVALSAVAYASLPIILGTAALSPQVVSIMLGPKWAGAAPIFQILAAGGVLVSLRSTNGWLFVSSGHTGRQALWALANRPVIIGGIIAGLPFGTKGVAWGFVVAHVILFLPSFLISIAGTPVRPSDIWQSLWRPVSLGAAIFVVARTIATGMHAPDALVVLVAVGVCGIMTVALVLVWPAMRGDLVSLRGALGSARRGEGEAGLPGEEPPSGVRLTHGTGRGQGLQG